jgi:nucleoside-diphosphate-sugar epimerase
MNAARRSFASAPPLTAHVLDSASPDVSNDAVDPYNILVTGTGSGLGHAVFDSLGGCSLRRGTALDSPQLLAAQPFDAIVHCSVNAAKRVTMETAYSYFDDNFLLTQRLLGMPHRKFIYVSSFDVYPRRGSSIKEDEDFDLDGLAGPYSFTKLFSELLVRKLSKNYLILRPSTLLGPVMRPNTTKRMLTERAVTVFLSGDSRFNYVLHEDVVAFIRLALDRDLTGIYNIASRDTVTLAEIAKQLDLDVHFGKHRYDIGPVDSGRAANVMRAFGCPSWETLNRFIDSLGQSYIGNGRLRSPALVEP